MKPAAKATIVCIMGVIVLPYVMGAFIQWQLNPRLWSGLARELTAALTGFLVVIVFIVSPVLPIIGLALFGDDE